MSLRGSRQADEAIPLSPGRRLLRFARKDIKDIKVCLCEEAARPTKQSPSRRGGNCFAWGCVSTHARKDIPLAGEEIA